MATRRGSALPTPESIASYVAKSADKVRKIQEQPHGQGMQSVREAEYKGHRIVVRTHYEFEVDGKMVMGHVGVTNDGQVHYHPVPNVSFASAVELVKQLIDIFPDDFKKKRQPGKVDHGDHGDKEGHAAPAKARPKKASA